MTPYKASNDFVNLGSWFVAAGTPQWFDGHSCNNLGDLISILDEALEIVNETATELSSTQSSSQARINDGSHSRQSADDEQGHQTNPDASTLPGSSTPRRPLQ